VLEPAEVLAVMAAALKEAPPPVDMAMPDELVEKALLQAQLQQGGGRGGRVEGGKQVGKQTTEYGVNRTHQQRQL
jgi:hypothetical protein